MLMTVFNTVLWVIIGAISLAAVAFIVALFVSVKARFLPLMFIGLGAVFWLVALISGISFSMFFTWFLLPFYAIVSVIKLVIWHRGKVRADKQQREQARLEEGRRLEAERLQREQWERAIALRIDNIFR